MDGCFALTGASALGVHLADVLIMMVSGKGSWKKTAYAVEIASLLRTVGAFFEMHVHILPFVPFRKLPVLANEKGNPRHVQDVMWKEELLQTARRASCQITANRVLQVIQAYQSEKAPDAPASAPAAPSSHAAGPDNAASATRFQKAGPAALLGVLGEALAPAVNPVMRFTRPDMEWPAQHSYAAQGRDEFASAESACMHVGTDAASMKTSGDLQQYAFIRPALPEKGVQERLVWGPIQVVVGCAFHVHPISV
jgi:hypothetical protein